MSKYELTGERVLAMLPSVDDVEVRVSSQGAWADVKLQRTVAEMSATTHLKLVLPSEIEVLRDFGHVDAADVVVPGMFERFYSGELREPFDNLPVMEEQLAIQSLEPEAAAKGQSPEQGTAPQEGQEVSGREVVTEPIFYVAATLFQNWTSENLMVAPSRANSMLLWVRLPPGTDVKAVDLAQIEDEFDTQLDELGSRQYPWATEVIYQTSFRADDCSKAFWLQDMETRIRMVQHRQQCQDSGRLRQYDAELAAWAGMAAQQLTALQTAVPVEVLEVTRYHLTLKVLGVERRFFSNTDDIQELVRLTDYLTMARKIMK